MKTDYFIHLELSGSPSTNEHSHDQCFCLFDKEIEYLKSKDEAVKYFNSLKKNDRWGEFYIQHASMREVISQDLEEYRF